MPLPRPSSFTNWTDSNPNFGIVTVEPDSGKKQNGWTPGEPPPCQFQNWLEYITDQWIKYLDSWVTQFQNTIAAYQPTNEALTGTVDGTNTTFTATATPFSKDACILRVNSRIVDNDKWTLVGKNVVFNSGEQPLAGDDSPKLYYLTLIPYNAIAPGAPAGVTPKTFYITLSSGNISSKGVTLPLAPADSDNTDVWIENDDTSQFVGIDYNISGTSMTWSGLGMDGHVSAGQTIKVRIFI